jgi:glycosyltransferase involved in cell wall biosynthesis
MRIERGEIRPGLQICTVTLPTRTNRPFGKAVNLLFARSLAREVLREIAGDGISLLWIYNGYAFESRFALEVMGKTGCPLVIELEDMPFARKRSTNLKPMLDDYYLRSILPEAKLVTCVNEFIARALEIPSGKTLLLPGLVDGNLVNTMAVRSPFSGPFRTAGYFGHLAEEKGADLLLQVIENPPVGWKFIVTGTGALAEKFAATARDAPELLRFFHNASDAKVALEMLKCDVIINPHRSIAEMGNGVFPFKVIEGLASGRLVISTTLPSCGLDLENCVLFFESNAESLRASLESAASFYFSRKDRVDCIAREIYKRHSESALAFEVRRIFFPVGA